MQKEGKAGFSLLCIVRQKEMVKQARIIDYAPMRTNLLQQ